MTRATFMGHHHGPLPKRLPPLETQQSTREPVVAIQDSGTDGFLNRSPGIDMVRSGVHDASQVR